ncbi:hypothetical protein BDD12DRAFT_896757 [Trichophaea hybrida]|nr:hypothetical protein BDD12DRAFT_896757 [Trichophaea hybrida]
MPRKGNKGLQQTLSTVVSSAFETPEILSVSPPPNVSTPPRWGISSEGSLTSTSGLINTIKRLLKLQKLDSYKEKFDLFEKRVKQQHDNMRDCFLQLQNNFFKKLENDEEATTRLQENDKSLREQIVKDKFKLQEEIGSLKNQVEELKTTVGSLQKQKRVMGEELKRLRASTVATTPPPPEKKKMIRPIPTLVIPLATQVLKRNLARKQEESRKKAELTMMKGQVEGRPSKTPRLVSPLKAQASKSEERKKSNDGRAQALKFEEKKKSETGWTEVKRKRRPRGPGTKIEDSRGYTLVWDTPTG